MSALRVAIVGGGWAGLSAAVAARQAGHSVTVFEATHALGGRARSLAITLPDGRSVQADNGQHILIGAYTHTLALLRQVGIELDTTLLRLPLSLRFADGSGLHTPALARHWPAPLDALAAIVCTKSWSWGERMALLCMAWRWQRGRFSCPSSLRVAQLCQGLPLRVMRDMVEPLCVAALNTPAQTASAQVFLRVLQDALFGVRGGSHLLLPRCDLSALLPYAAQRWLAGQAGSSAQVHLGQRVQTLAMQGRALAPQWSVNDQPFDAVICAADATAAARLVSTAADHAPPPLGNTLRTWAAQAQALRFEAITTVYAWQAGARLNAPMVALRSGPQQPAQFAFDRGQLGGPAGLLALVASASASDRSTVQAQALTQAREQLGWSHVQVLQTVVEKRATFACTPGLQRPPALIAPGLLAAGDYVAGPYPATLEGAVRSGQEAARLLGVCRTCGVDSENRPQ